MNGSSHKGKLPEGSLVGPLVSKFLKVWIPKTNDRSPHTVRSYVGMFKLLNRFMEERCGVPPARLTFELLDEEALNGFVTWMIEVRGMKPGSVNTRIGALKSFAKFVTYENPAQSRFGVEVDKLKMRKKDEEIVRFMSVDALRAIFDAAASESLLDLAMLEVLYASGARESEFVALTPRAVRFSKDGTASIELHGKGRKARVVKIGRHAAYALKVYVGRYCCDADGPLFPNRKGGFMSTSGLVYTVRKYADAARRASPGLVPERVHPHMFRHSVATHMLRAGKSMEEVRLFLGHASLETTRIYAKCDPDIVSDAIAVIDEKSIKPVAARSDEEKGSLDAWLAKAYGL